MGVNPYQALQNNYLRAGQAYAQQLGKIAPPPAAPTQQIDPHAYDDKFKSMTPEQSQQFDKLCADAGLSQQETIMFKASETGKHTAEDVAKEVGIDYSTDIGKLSFNAILKTANDKIVAKYGAHQ